MNRSIQYTVFLFILCLTIAFAGSLTLAADQDNTPTITVSGQATLRTRPELMRCTLLLSAKGKTVSEAVAALAQHRDDVKQKLAASGAVSESVKITDAVMGDGAAPTGLAAQMQRIAMMNRGQQKPVTTQPVSFTVSCTYQADWPIPASSPEDALIKASALQEKIKASIPKAGTNTAMTPEEQEIAEEVTAQSAQNDASGTPAQKPDEPSFSFVHKLSDDERSRLATDAFTSATADANRLATAAGQTLGRVKTLSQTNGAGDASNPYTAYIQAMTGAATSPGSKLPSEVTGDQASSVTITVDINASFDMR